MRIVAGLWGVELSAPDAYTGLQRLAPALLDRRLVGAVLAALPEAARQALDDLAQNGGLLPWAAFTRRYGVIREMGPGRRDRERPYLNPASPAEALWYRALAARAFFDSAHGPEEYAYIPADLLELMEAAGAGLRGAFPARWGRPASPAERARTLSAGDRLLDHAVTLLAALRIGEPALLEQLPVFHFESGLPLPLPAGVLQQLLAAAGLLDEGGLPHLEHTRAFLEAPRAQALALLARAWLESRDFNELRQLPGLACEGDWQNDPLLARRTVLDWTLNLFPAAGQGGRGGPPAGEKTFWSLSAFVAAVKQNQPDFQRPAGDYDSWYIRRREGENGAEGDFLRGFEHWDAIDGALVRYLICGPFYWLGLVELGGPEAADEAGAAEGRPPEGRAAAFRLSGWARELLKQEGAPRGFPAERESLHAGSNGRLRLPRLAPRAARYQIARFCHWSGKHDGSEEAYRYRLSPSSLERARQAGLRAGHLLALLRRHAPTVPPALARALERWEERGAEARLERVTVLRLSSPDLLTSLRSSHVARFLGDPLGPTAVIVKPGAWEKVLAYLAELGFLAENRVEGEDTQP